MGAQKTSKSRSKFPEDVTSEKEVPMDVLYDTFDVPAPIPAMIVPRLRKQKVGTTFQSIS